MKRLVINADDFGFSEGVTRGILDAHAAGVVTSTSVLANATGTEAALERARATPTLGVGLHLNLVQGRPLCVVPSLTDRETGELLSLRALARRAVAGDVRAADVALELRTQLARVRSAGVRVTHLDSHRHAHLLPGIWDVVTAIAAREGVGVVRAPRERLTLFPGDLVATGRKLALRLVMLGASLPRPLRAPDHFVGLSLQGGDRFERRLMRVLDRLRPGVTELMVHVGHVDDTLTALDPYTWERERELAVLTSPAVRERLRRGDIQLGHFGRL